MTFQLYENSNQDGIPVRLYEFVWGLSALRYNSSDRDLTVGGNLYKGVSMLDNGFQQNGEPTTETMTIACPTNLPIVAKFRGTPPSETMRVNVRDLHYDDAYGSGDIANVPITWIGEVATCRRVDTANAEITANVLTISMKRGGLRLGWQKGCPHFLFDTSCRVNKAAYALPVTGTVTASHLAVSTDLSGKPDGYFAGGFVEWTDTDGTVETRGVVSQSGQNLTLFGTIDDADGVAGSNFVIYPGCKRTIDYCDSAFNNRANYGGAPHIPSKSPFDGNPIY